MMKIIAFLLMIQVSYSSVDKLSRVKNIKSNLVAMSTVKSQRIKKMISFVDLISTGNCLTTNENLYLACLIGSVKRSCRDLKGKKKRSNCLSYGDLIISNKMSEKQFISRSEKFKMLKKSKSYQQAISRKRKFIASKFLSDFYFSKDFSCKQKSDFECYALGINEYCEKLGSVENVSWGHCVSQLTLGIKMI